MEYVTYVSQAGYLSHGYIADTAISPLSGAPRVLIVDSYSEALAYQTGRDPDVGKWIYETAIVKRGYDGCPVCKVMAERYPSPTA